VCHQTFFQKESLIKTLSFFGKERTCAKKETEKSSDGGEKRRGAQLLRKKRKSPDFYF